MIVRCVSEGVSTQGVTSVAGDYDVMVGTSYPVFGLRGLGKTLWVDLLSDFGYLRPVPLGLFEVVDGRIPSGWSFGPLSRDGDWALWPTAFWQPYFHDDLSGGDPIRNQELAAVRNQLAGLHGMDQSAAERDHEG